MDPTVIAIVVTAILGSGGIGALATYRKANSEADDIAARTLIAVNSELRTEMDRRYREYQRELERRDVEITSLRARVSQLEQLLSGGTA